MLGPSTTRKSGPMIKGNQMPIFKTRVLFLGYMMSADEVATDDTKISAVRKFSTPNSLLSLRSLVGLASYYRRFVKNFAQMAQLDDLVTKDVEFQWTERQQTAFEKLKATLIAALHLSFRILRKCFTCLQMWLTSRSSARTRVRVWAETDCLCKSLFDNS